LEESGILLEKDSEALMLNQEELAHIARLARLELSSEETGEYSQQLSKAISYFQQIEKVKTEGVEPLVTPTDIELALRADEAQKEYTSQEMLANAPHKTGHLFTVPPVV
jgi:aspartyl-tRNA(Asn)/glutamyl-tRNA(Gln) amidotransferase subunit C